MQQAAISTETKNQWDVFMPLRSVQHLKKSNSNLFGHLATVDCLNYFHQYLKSNHQITKIAIIGFNAGILLRVFIIITL